MRYTQLFGKTRKNAPADTGSNNARYLTQGGFIFKQMAGVYNYLPLGLRVLQKIQNIVRKELNIFGAQELLMPALSLEETYKQTGRDNLDILFKLEGHGGDLVLNQSHEDIVTPIAKQMVASYKDLPFGVYQIQDKFRNEPRAKSGILRGREFNMKDLYSFHLTQEDRDSYYDSVKQVYFKIYTALGFPKDKVVYTYASGGDFSRYSNEFQILSDIGEDTIYLCKKCNVAVNDEIKDEHNSCPECGNVDLAAKKSIEVGNIFKLGTKFSDAFNFTLQDENGDKKKIEMCSYGIGCSRLMGTLVEVFSDDKGIMWPKEVSPFDVHLVSVGKDKDEVIAADKLYKDLVKKGLDVLYDDRENCSAGEKFNDADLIGIPIRLTISKKTIAKNSVELKLRNGKESALVTLDKVIEMLK